MNIVFKRWVSGTFTLAFIALLALPVFASASVNATAQKVFVCKYVGKPGVNEVLQTGQNPISVSKSAIKNYPGVGGYFNDAQGRSLVVAEDEGQPEPRCPAPTTPKKVSPVLECVETVGEGTYIARFGYNNRNEFAVNVPVGNENKITGGGLTGQDQGQTTEFQPGRVVDSFRVEFDGSNLVWTLSYAGQTATSTASSESKACPQEEKIYRFAFDKVWAGDAFDKSKVTVTFTAVVGGAPFSWTLGQDPAVEVIPGITTLVNLEEKVSGLPENCKVISTNPVFPVVTLTAPRDTSLYVGDNNQYTSLVTNTVDCVEPGVGGGTPVATTVSTTTPPAQVAAVPVGAANTGAGALGSIAGLFGSLGMLAAGFVARRYTIV